MARILLSAYACEPDRGSEPGVGWNWASELAALGHRVWVLTRAENRPSTETTALARDPNVAFVYYDLPRWAQRLRKAAIGKRIYYVAWQWGAVRYVRKTFPVLPFDIVQHVTYVSVRYPSFMGLLGIPFCFGPVSGGETVPHHLRAGSTLGERWRERLRDFSNALVRFDPLLGSAFRRAEKILVTRDTLALVSRRWRHKCEVQLAIGITGTFRAGRGARPRIDSGCLRLLYVGRLLEWKGLDIALRAVSQLKPQMEVRFTIVGDGPCRARLVNMAEKLGVSEVVDWTGWLPQRRVQDFYGAHDVFLFPSLRDSGAMSVLEAMAHALPVVCTDLGGPGVIVNGSCGRVLPTARKSRKELAADFATALQEVAATPNLRTRLAAGARKRARDFAFRNLVDSVYPAGKLPANTASGSSESCVATLLGSGSHA